MTGDDGAPSRASTGGDQNARLRIDRREVLDARREPVWGAEASGDQDCPSRRAPPPHGRPMSVPSSDLTILPCGPADGPALAALAARLFLDTYGTSHPEPQLSRYVTRELSAERVTAELSAGVAAVWWALADGGEPVGYVWVQDMAPPIALPASARRPLRLRRIFVDPAWHGRGVAAALVETAAAGARQRGADALWLAVWQRAARPVAFYRKAGFVVAGTATFDMEGHLDEDFVMLRALA